MCGAVCSSGSTIFFKTLVFNVKDLDIPFLSCCCKISHPIDMKIQQNKFSSLYKFSKDKGWYWLGVPYWDHLDQRYQTSVIFHWCDLLIYYLSWFYLRHSSACWFTPSWVDFPITQYWKMWKIKTRFWCYYRCCCYLHTSRS